MAVNPCYPPVPNVPSRNHALAGNLFIVFVLALTMRVGFCFIVVPAADLPIGPRSREFYTSTDGYVKLAVNLFEHGRYSFHPEGSPTTYRAPVYPFVLGLVNVLVADIGTTTLLVNCLASSLTCTLLGVLAAHIFGRNRALLLSMPATFFPLSVYYCTNALSDTFFALTIILYVVLALTMLADPSVSRAILAGGALGVATLTKGILVPFPLLFLGYAALRRPRAFKAVFTSSIVSVGLVAIWSARKYVVSGHVIPVSVGPGWSMLSGNYMIEVSRDAHTAVKYGEARALKRINATCGGSYTYGSLRPAGHWDIPHETDSLFFREALLMFREDPLLLPRKLGINAFRFWYFSNSPWKCHANLAVNGSVVLLALVGMFRVYRRAHRSVEFTVIVSLFFILVYSVVNVSSSRYGLPIVLLLTPFAGWPLMELVRRVCRSRHAAGTCGGKAVETTNEPGWS